MGFNVRLEVAELGQCGVDVGSHHRTGFLELSDVGTDQLELLKDLINFLGMQELKHGVAGHKVFFELYMLFVFKFVKRSDIVLHLFY